MTFLPIVERELRVAARKRSTYWLRVVAVAVALVLGTGFMLISAMGGVGTAQLGSTLFNALTWLAMVPAVCAGLFFTSDAVSEEKREGTLGFLFLTDLRGYDVAAGKLLATSLRGSFALLAFFPVLAITLLMGGVTGAQFWKTTLALLNVLFFSLSAGLLISALSRDAQKAMAGTLALLLFLVVGGPVIDSIGRSGPGSFLPRLSLLSPAYAFSTARAWGHPPFWLALLMSGLCGWVMLLLACWLVPRTWKERGLGAPVMGSRAYERKYGRPERRARLRRLLEVNPILWLNCRERWQPIGIWVLTVAVLGTFVAVALLLPSEVWFVWRQCSYLYVLLLYLWMASQASRFFVDARRTGVIELLLIAPLGGKEIVLGQWRALWRLFALPVMLLVAAHVLGMGLSHESIWSVMAQRGPGLAEVILSLAMAVVSGISVGANLLALSWYGMWAGLTSKNATLASLKTLLVVQVVPWLGIWFVSTFVAGLIVISYQVVGTGPASSTMAITFPLVMGGVSAALAVGKDACFIVWARKKLFTSFHEQVVRSASPARLYPVARARRPSPAPPLIVQHR
jgi:ABC-type transport system involved in multi-copper enzyme maturation permease subunit